MGEDYIISKISLVANWVYRKKDYKRGKVSLVRGISFRNLPYRKKIHLVLANIAELSRRALGSTNFLDYDFGTRPPMQLRKYIIFVSFLLMVEMSITYLI